MAKALKTVAIVAGAAALVIATGGAAAGIGLSLATSFAGVSAGALLASSALASTAAALLTKAPKVPAAQTDRLTAQVDPRAFRKTVLGQTAMPVDIRYEEWSGTDQEYCDWIVCHASHAIDGIEEIWLNTELAWSQTTGVTRKYLGYFSVPNIVLEGSPTNAFTFASGRWNGSTRLTGCAYSRFRFKVTGNGKKATSPFSSGIPSRITVIGRGAKLYDPRRDSTVPGGSGPMRWDDQATWRYTADDGAVIGENLPLHALRVVLGWRIRNPGTGEMRLATGSGVPGRRLRLESWIEAANLADELVNRSAGGQEARYHGAGVISEGDDPGTSLEAVCAACNGRFRDTGGRLSFTIAHNDLAAAAIDDGLHDDDVIGGHTWDPDPSLDGTPNVVRGQYVDATSGSLYQLVDYPEVRLPSPDGQDRILTLNLGVCESPSHAQRIAKQVLQRKQYQREFTAPFDIRAWKYQVGSILPFTFAPLSFNRALFRVKAQELAEGGVCNMTLTVEHPAIYQWDRDDAAPVLAAEPIVYDASKNPIVLAIEDASNSADWDGVTGPGKPDDNADVTGENTSKDTNAVGGVPAGDITGRLNTLVTGTIPAIDAAGAAAGQRITEARAAADLALSTIENEVERVDQRIDNISASGGYDDTAVYAEVRRVDEVSLGRDAALGTRIDTVTASVTTTDTNLRALVETKETAAVGREGAISQRLDQLIAEGGGGSEGVDTVARSEISRVEQASVLGQQALSSRATTLEASSRADPTMMNGNANFSDWPDERGTIPNGWGLVAAGAGSSAARVPGLLGKWRLETSWAGGAGDFFYAVSGRNFSDIGGGIDDGMFGGPGWYVMEADVTLVGGSLAGSGFYCASYNGSGATIYIAAVDFPNVPANGAAAPGAGLPGARYKFSTLVDFTDPNTRSFRFHPMVAWTSFGGDTPAKVLRWNKAGLRSATPQEIAAQQAGAGIIAANARIKTTEDTLADLPNRYATAQRASNIEAAVSGVGGRINSLETVTSNGTFATAARAEQIASYAGGVGATVTQQAGTIAGLGQKTAAYVRIIADAGNGPAVFSLWSDQYGGAWALGGNGQIDGNLTVNGTVTARKFDGASMAREASSSWSGSISANPGQTVSVPWSLSLPSIPPTGRFIYELTIEVTSNAGTGFYQYDGQGPIYNSYVEDGGGYFIQATDPQGNIYRPRPNSSDRVLATTDFVPNFTAFVRRGTRDQLVTDGDGTRTHYYAATWTITRIDLKVTWVAI